MSTESAIIIQNENGTCEGIYCHWDGYPENQMPILTGHYKDEAKIRELIALGSLSSLDKEIGVKHDFNNCPEGMVNAYHRDRNESWEHTKPQCGNTWQELAKGSHYEYAYIFDVKTKTWTCEEL